MQMEIIDLIASTFLLLLPGDNHCGYIGFRGLPPFETILRDDGSMDVVVEDWLDNNNKIMIFSLPF